MRDLGVLSGGYSEARDINNKGQIVGHASLSGTVIHPVLWQNGKITDLGTLGGDIGLGYGINNGGQVVGDADTSSGVRHAFLWQNGTITDLNSLLPANSGWELTTAQDINNTGQIVGSGKFNGLDRAFLLTPTWVSH
jgi:probable HAF family extracellular repeat protein